LLFVVFFAYRISQYAHYASKALWSVESLVFAVLAAVYAVRVPPRVRPAGVLEFLVPYTASALPFAMGFVPIARVSMTVAWLVMGVGEALTIAAVSTLGASFGITVAVRAPVSRGLYRWVRHPVYCGEIVTTAGLAWIHQGWAAGALLVAFVAVQAWRARLEERKLVAACPDYATYQAQTGMFWPSLQSRRQASSFHDTP
jgi:protein-S-isoprenylcysteine O-methyltransferase Ste14